MNTGLRVSIYRDADGSDCTNNGISSRYTNATITGEGIEGPFSPSDDAPEMVIIKDEICGRERIRAIPKDLHESKLWVMFGGNFVYSSDSRFPANAPIMIFDRVER